MNRNLKILMWSIAAIFIIAVAGWYIFLHFISVAFREKCDIHRVWKIENYEIIEKECIGFAGPYYYPVNLYKDQKEIGRAVYISDTTCIVKFISKKGDILRFDICNMNLKKMNDGLKLNEKTSDVQTERKKQL